MKKHSILFILFITAQMVYSQCDNLSIKIVNTSGVEIDAVSTNETFRINGYNNQAITWFLYTCDGGYLDQSTYSSTTWTEGRTKSTAGYYCYYYNCSEKTDAIEVYAPTSSGQWNQVRSDSELETNNLGNKIFYINTSKQVCNLWKNGSTWEDAVLNNNSNIERAESGHGLVWNPLDQCVYYIGDSDYKIHGFYWNSVDGWQEDVVVETQQPVRSVSELITNTGGDHIYYISSDLRVSALWKSGSTWYDDYDLAPNAPDAKTGRGLVYNNTLGELYYVDENNKIIKLFYSSGWQYEQVASGQWNNVKSNSELKVPSWGTDIVYVRTDGKMCKLSKSGSSWYDSGPIVSSAPSVKDGSDFDYSDDGIFYIDVNNNIQKLGWSSSAGWTCSKVKERQLDAVNSVLSFNSNVYFTYTNNNQIYSYSLNTTKSSKVTPNNYEIPQFDLDKIDYSIYPNPSNGSFYISGLIEPVKIEVVNIQGRLVYENKKYTGEKIIIPHLEKGMLYVRIYGSKGEPLTKKLINN